MSAAPPRGLIIAAPQSGSGKTSITLGLLRALRGRGFSVRGAKSGPDYIDPRFHEAASGRACLNLDAWAMSPDRIRARAQGDGLLIVEGAMGLFDGALPDGKGATADLARILGLPVVLVVDASRMAQSITPLVRGFMAEDPEIQIAGVILNRVGSDKHERMLRAAFDPVALPILGVVPRMSEMALPSRHLGLVQAAEHQDLENFIQRFSDVVGRCCDVEQIAKLSRTFEIARQAPIVPLSAHRRVAIARDAAFGFSYPHLLADWQAVGAQIQFFSPLANDPVPEADLVFLPGGYPELHAEQLARNTTFLSGLKNAAQHTEIYGECGGFMVLGKRLIDADGQAHKMAGLLSLETSFADRKLHLGYRRLTGHDGWLTGDFAAHEFHYATTIRAEGEPLFQATDAEGMELPPMGLRTGRVRGSFAHIIERL